MHIVQNQFHMQNKNLDIQFLNATSYDLKKFQGEIDI